MIKIFNLNEAIYHNNLGLDWESCIDLSCINKERWYVYILQSLHPNHKNLTYIGKTNDLNRRLRQHNGDISDGKNWTGTRKGQPWKIVGYITGFNNETEALQLEWRLHHPFNRNDKKNMKIKGLVGMKKRIRDMKHVLQLDQWTRSSPKISDLQLYVFWLDVEYKLDINHIKEIKTLCQRLPMGSKRLNKL